MLFTRWDTLSDVSFEIEYREEDRIKIAFDNGSSSSLSIPGI